MKTRKRIAITASSLHFLRSRSHLIRNLTKMGHKVFCVVPTEEDANHENEFGAELYFLPLQKTGFNPLSDLRFLFKLIKLFRRLHPDMTIAYTIKPVIYFSIAARIVKVPFINSVITGLGYVFINNSFRQKIARFIALNLYKIALAFNQKVFFLNPDDQEEFLKLGMVKPSQCELINGSGVDLKHFSYSPWKNKKPSFILIARMLKEKGIMEFIQAAEIVKKSHPDIEFNIVGPSDTGPSAIKTEKFQKYINEGLISYHGFKKDVRSFLRNSAVYVLPSYREGLPKTSLEAMAVGRAIITTDTAGCRETVKNGVNGYLIPPRNSSALAQAMLKFIDNPSLAQKMGQASRKLVENKFSVDEVNESLISCLNLSGT